MKIRDRIKELRRVRASELLPNPLNWRKHPEAQANALRGILAEVGIADAVLARETPDGLQLLDGHLRAEIAPDAMMPVLVLDVDEAEARKILATHDTITGMAETDHELLAELVKQAELVNEDIDKMLADVLKSIEEEPKDEPNNPDPEEDDFSPPADDEEIPTTIQAGDLITLGPHRLLCGDSTDAESVAYLMDGAKADICFTSPPYGQQRDYTSESREHTKNWDDLLNGVFANLPMTDEGQVLVNLGLIHRNNEWIPYWEQWIEWMRSQGWRRFGWYVWDQGFGLPGDWNGRLAPSFEFVFHFNRHAVKPVKFVPSLPNASPMGSFRKKNGQLSPAASPHLCGQSHKIPDSVVRLSRANTIGINHPAQFPIALPHHFLQAWPGIAYEPFCGSGTTIIAADQLDRVCYAMEISPKYCQVIVDRFIAYRTKAGKDAVVTINGESYLRKPVDGRG